MILMAEDLTHLIVSRLAFAESVIIHAMTRASVITIARG